MVARTGETRPDAADPAQGAGTEDELGAIVD